MHLTKNIFVLLVIIVTVSSAKTDRVRLRDVQVLTLHSDKWTTARRSAPVKQLTCVGGPGHQAKVHTVQCYNRGFDGTDIQWECKAEMPSNYQFGRLEVSCEGYDYPNDDHVLAGSCGLEYTILEASESSNSNFASHPKAEKDSDGTSILTLIVVVGAAGVALYYFLLPKETPVPNAPNANNGRSWFNSNPSAPPPAGFRPDYAPNANNGRPWFYSSGENCNTHSTGTGTGSSTETSSGPGFYSGMATGGLLGYLFGSNRGNNGYARRAYQDNSFWSAPSSSRYSSFDRSSYSDCGGRTSTGTKTSTGFASTKRR